MTSPDFREYVDLTINDVQPDEIYEQAVDYALTALPDFSPRRGTVEDAMLQAISYVAGITTGAINRLPDSLMEGILRLVGFERDEQTFATGFVSFESIDDSGVTIPSGFQVSFSEVTATETIQHIFQTTESAQILLGETISPPVPIVAIEAGEKPPISDGDSMLVLSASNKILACQFFGSINQGEAGESDANYFARGATFLSSLSSALATVSQVDSYLMTTFKEIFRAKTYDLSKVREVGGLELEEVSGLLKASISPSALSGLDPAPAAGDVVRIFGASPDFLNGIFTIDSVGEPPDYAIYFDNTVGASSGEVFNTLFRVELLEDVNTNSEDAAGYVVSFITDSEGNDFSQGFRQSVNSDVLNKVVAGLKYRSTNALILPLEVNVSISVLSGFSTLDVRQAVDAAITQYLSPQKWDWSPIIRRNAVITRISQVAGVSYIESLTIEIAEDEVLANTTVDGDIVFRYKGVLPRANVVVGSV
jgi:hypothetical protein